MAGAVEFSAIVSPANKTNVCLLMAPNKLMKMTVDLDFFNKYLKNKSDSAMCKISKTLFRTTQTGVL